MDDQPVLGAPIVVGVDGSRAARQAVFWAADEAALRGASLLIVHVDVETAEAVGLPCSTAGCEALLDDELRAALDVQPDLRARSRLVRGPAVADGLLDVSRDADLIVLGVDPTRTRASHGPLGPIEERVAVRAPCPVVAVSGRLHTTDRTSFPVVVGWTDTHAGHLALVAGAAAAALRKVRLVVVTVPPARDPDVEALVHPISPEPVLIEGVSAAERRHPGLVIDIAHATGDATAALVEHSARADLLVLGCHHTSRPWNYRPGPVAGPALRQAHCPVMLVGRLAHITRQGAGDRANSPRR
jgi:nucleotide-binding universal stress UspA family protein